MDSCTTELISNASAQLFSDNALSSLTNFLPEQLNVECQWEVGISELSYLPMHQNITEEKFMFFDEKLSESSDLYYLDPGLYHSITVIVEAMN